MNVGAAISAACRSWLTATRDHLGHTHDEQLNYSPITAEQFDAGYGHASGYRSSR